MLVLSGCSSVIDDEEALQVPVIEDVSGETEQESDGGTDMQAPPVDPSDGSGSTVVNERGNIVRGFGQLATLTKTSESGSTTSEFTVIEIEPHFLCPSELADPPVNGNYVAITFDITTAPASAEGPDWYMTRSNLHIISPDGMRENAVDNACLELIDELPTSLGKGEHVRGKMVLDTAYTSGYLVVTFDDSPVGWEWAF